MFQLAMLLLFCTACMSGGSMLMVGWWQQCVSHSLCDKEKRGGPFAPTGGSFGWT